VFLQDTECDLKRVTLTDAKHALRHLLQTRIQQFRFGTLLMPTNQNLSKKIQRQIILHVIAKKYNITIDWHVRCDKTF
jgi:hypothetical protein